MSGENQRVFLRRARTEDATEIGDIWYRGWRDGHLGHVSDQLVAARTERSFYTRAAQRVGDTTVAIVDGAVTGFVMVVDDEVEQVYVDANHRGSGVAVLLLKRAERLVKGNGYARAWLAVVAGNVRARRFYERNGWADDGPFDYLAYSKDGRIPVRSHRYVKDLPEVGPSSRDDARP